LKPQQAGPTPPPNIHPSPATSRAAPASRPTLSLSFFFFPFHSVDVASAFFAARWITIVFFSWTDSFTLLEGVLRVRHGEQWRRWSISRKFHSVWFQHPFDLRPCPGCLYAYLLFFLLTLQRGVLFPEVLPLFALPFWPVSEIFFRLQIFSVPEFCPDCVTPFPLLPEDGTVLLPTPMTTKGAESMFLLRSFLCPRPPDFPTRTQSAFLLSPSSRARAFLLLSPLIGSPPYRVME